MAFLPPSPLKLTGGCFCSAIRYKINIPALSDRPLVPGALRTPIPTVTPIKSALDSPSATAGGQTVETRFPIIDIDHCGDCRRACGGLVQCWIICETSWVDFELIQRTTAKGNGHFTTEEISIAQRYPTLDVVKASAALQAETYAGRYTSDGESLRMFCTRCGTPMTYHADFDRGPQWKLGPLVDITIGTLDQDSLNIEGVRPDRHGWWESGTPWIKDILYKGTGSLVRMPTGRLANVIEEDKHLLCEIAAYSCLLETCNRIRSAIELQAPLN